MSGSGVAGRLAALRARAAAAAERAGRAPAEVTLIGVAKRQPAALVVEAVAAGLADVAENFVQEAREKIPAVREALAARGLPAPRFHLVGRLQSNKARLAAPLFDCVQSVDRADLAKELARRAEAAGRTIDALVQVNLSGEPQKGGVAPDGLPSLLEACAAFPGLALRGLMTVPEDTQDAALLRARFAALRELRDTAVRAGHAGVRELSMGMSGDFELAIEAGATWIRIGTALFGARGDSVMVERNGTERGKSIGTERGEPTGTERVGFIGAGAMAEALAGGLLAGGVAARNVAAVDPDPARRKAFEALGVRALADAAELVEASDTVVLAVKPAVVVPALAALGSLTEDARRRPLWVSIAAGVPIAKLAGALPTGARVVRAMPNTPALVRSGATAFVASAEATAADRAAARRLFEAVGYTWEAPNEGLLDAVTGLSGSGPAYVFVFLETLADAGVAAGLPRDAAYQLAFHTVQGSAKLALETGRHPGSLKDQVTSPGGTTIAGLERLEAGGFRAALYEAVAAATRRARELGR